MTNKIKLLYSEKMIEELNKPFSYVDSIHGISYRALRSQIAFRNHLSVFDVDSISIQNGTVVYNDNKLAGTLNEYFSSLVEYKKSCELGLDTSSSKVINTYLLSILAYNEDKNTFASVIENQHEDGSYSSGLIHLPKENLRNFIGLNESPVAFMGDLDEFDRDIILEKIDNSFLGYNKDGLELHLDKTNNKYLIDKNRDTHYQNNTNCLSQDFTVFSQSILETDFKNKDFFSTQKELLEQNGSVTFVYDGCIYDIFVSENYDDEDEQINYNIDVYEDNENARDADGDFNPDFVIDGGLCTGGAEMAVFFSIANPHRPISQTTLNPTLQMSNAEISEYLKNMGSKVATINIIEEL